MSISDLPITEYLSRIVGTLSDNNVVLQAEPGAGKSTALPLSLLDAEWLEGKKIIMLEPRRVAAKSIAHYLAAQLGEKVGQRVGYQIKNERKISRDTQLEIVTEGILTRRLQHDPEMEEVGLIVFDEFHERSLHADLALLLSLEIQQAIREDLRLLVMSATVDTAAIAGYMGKSGLERPADIIECPGRTFPVDIAYAGTSQDYLPDRVVAALRSVMASNSDGDVLIFLPGQGDIERCITKAHESLNCEGWLMLPLYGALTLAQQEQALVPDPNGKRRAVFTTNIAETSLTIEGVTAVIDSGLEKELTYDPQSGMTRLQTVYISRASATQRAGRAGRTQAGRCVRLWGEEKHRGLREYQPEEILSADLTGLLLELFQWGVSAYEDVNWLTPPPRAHYDSARTMLESLGMLDTDGKLTPLGSRALAIGLPPRLSAMLLQSCGDLEQSIACDLGALLADRDIFQHGSGVDISERILAIEEYRFDRKSALKRYPLKRGATEQLLASSRNYRKLLNLDTAAQNKASLADIQDSVARLLCFAYPDRLAKRRGHEGGRYQLANGRGVFLPEGDRLWGEAWLAVAECDAQKREGRIISAAPVSLSQLKEYLGDKIEEQESFQFDRDKQSITGLKVERYGALELKSTRLNEIPDEVFSDCLQQVLKDTGLELLNWTPKCEQWLARAHWLGQQQESFPSLSKDSLCEQMEEWLFPYLSGVRSVADLKKINVFDLLLGLLSWDEQNYLNNEAPESYTAPGGQTVTLAYNSQQGPTVSIQLQQMFGQLESPLIGGGKVPVRFELLSPARRPIQTTSDLDNFWKTSYHDVAKDMRGRYPKHRWPDEPLLEKPGRSIKAKKRD